MIQNETGGDAESIPTNRAEPDKPKESNASQVVGLVAMWLGAMSVKYAGQSTGGQLVLFAIAIIVIVFVVARICRATIRIAKPALNNDATTLPTTNQRPIRRIPIFVPIMVLAIVLVPIFFLLTLRAKGPSTAAAEESKPWLSCPIVPTTPNSGWKPPASDSVVADPFADAQSSPSQLSGKPLTADELFRRVSPSVFVVDVADASGNWVCFGSGFLVSDNGLLVTNFHVIRNGSKARLKTADGQHEFAVTGVAATDPDGDLALLQTDAKGKPLAIGADDPPAIGNAVYAIGSPEGLANSLSPGIISGVREDEDSHLPKLQTTAPISHGSSGGPLLTPDAKVVGVTSSGFADGENLNFAVPASRIRRLLASRGDVIPLVIAANADAANDDKKLFSTALSAIDQSQFQDAADTLANIHDKNTAEYWDISGQLYAGLHNFKLAARDYQKAIALDGTKDFIFEHLGEALSGDEQYDAAIDAFRKCLKIEPTNINAWQGAAWAFELDKQYQRAIGVVNKSIHLDPNDPDWYGILGECYLNLNRYSDSADAYRKYTELKPDDVAGWAGRGDAARLAHDYTDAETYYEKALAICPTDAESYCSLGLLNYSQGNIAAAQSDWQNAYRFDPSSPFGIQALGYLQNPPTRN